MPENSDFKLPEKSFSREELEKSLIGKIVLVRGAAANFSVAGVLVVYQSNDIAVLSPYIHSTDSKYVIVPRKMIIEQPVVVSEFDCYTLEEVIRRYTEPKKALKT